MAETVRLYLPHPMDRRARRGEHNFVNQLDTALERSGMALDICTATATDTRDAARWGGRALFLMQEPRHDLGLSLRVAYIMPFWRIETTAERWRFDVARAEFDPEGLDRAEARRFTRFWGKRKFGAAVENTERAGVIYVPLQGHLRRQRSFQHAAPIDMLEQTLQRASGRRVLAGLHPKESYSDADLAGLETLSARYPILEVQTGGMEEALRTCDFVVTQNSAAALMAMFFGKPAMIWARIDFHHAMVDAGALGAETAFDRIERHAPDYEAYLLWFLKLTAINAGAPDAPDQIAARLSALGWSVR